MTGTNLPSGNPIPGKAISEKEQLAKLILDYILHAQVIALHSKSEYYHSVTWLVHMDAVKMLKSICRNIKEHNTATLTLYTWNAISHLDNILPISTNASYQSSLSKLYEIKKLLSNISAKFRR